MCNIYVDEENAVPKKAHDLFLVSLSSTENVRAKIQMVCIKHLQINASIKYLTGYYMSIMYHNSACQ